MPAYPLDLKTDVNGLSRGSFTNSNAGAGAISSVVVTTDGGTLFLSSHAAARVATRYGVAMGGYNELLANGSSGLLFGTGTSATPIIFGNNSLERMRITSDGNVGIGTTVPAALLSVGSTSQFQVNSNGRILPRVGTTASSATPTPNADTDDLYTVTALAADATFGAPSGTSVNGQKLMIRVKDNGTARALAWNAIYRAVGATLPTTTVISKTLYLGMVYNSADSKWDVLAVAQE